MDQREESMAFPMLDRRRLVELERELSDLRLSMRSLARQLRKTEARYAEIEQAYVKTVANLVHTTQENMSLRHECERLRRSVDAKPSYSPLSDAVFGLHLTLPEIAAVRKAMARLHHPDVGGDVQRMQAWNVALDILQDETHQ
ncbi:MAG: hypothetical protein NVS4B8_06640 [Herpetosiphon sp.]